jgi:hypothetical protein
MTGKEIEKLTNDVIACRNSLSYIAEVVHASHEKAEGQPLEKCPNVICCEAKDVLRETAP